MTSMNDPVSKITALLLLSPLRDRDFDRYAYGVLDALRVLRPEITLEKIKERQMELCKTDNPSHIWQVLEHH